MSEYIHVSVAWPYANGPLHVGHVAGAYLPADIFARYHRLKGNHVLLVSGSDTHGTPVTIAAERAGVHPRDIVEKYHRDIIESQRDLGISYDLYTHTDTENHHRVVRGVFRRLLEKGYLKRQTQRQLYSETQGRFLPDRLVEGTCPHCGYGEARGDQCDHCRRLIDALDLIEPRSKLDAGTPTVREAEHFFFDLPAFRGRLRRYLENGAGRFRPNVYRFSRNFVEELRPRAVTRDLDWGIEVPVAGWQDKRIYVWFEAVIGYLSASIEWAERQGEPEAWKRWWYDPAARIYNFLGKDNIPFHTVIWPAQLLGLGHLDGDRGASLNLPHDVPANEYLNLDGEQLSTSRGHAVWLSDLLARYEVDAVRYYVAATLPETRDAEFSRRELHRRVTTELVAAWGNLCHRVLGFAHRRFAGTVPAPGALRGADEAILGRSEAAFEAVGAQLEAVRLRAALRAALAVVHDANAYLTERAPWQRIASDPVDAATSVYTALRVIDNLKTLLAPFLPFSSQRLHEQLGQAGRLFGKTRIETEREATRGHRVLTYDGAGAVGRWCPSELAAGQQLGPCAPLFVKLDQVAEADRA